MVRPKKIIPEMMVTAIGTGVKEDFKLEDSRYHKIILMTDADVDGAHIRTLLLTFFFRQMPELIEAGYVFIAQPPLYRVARGKEEYYAYDEAERDGYAKRLGGDGKSSVSAGINPMAARLADAFKAGWTNLQVWKAAIGVVTASATTPASMT